MSPEVPQGTHRLGLSLIYLRLTRSLRKNLIKTNWQLFRYLGPKEVKLFFKDLLRKLARLSLLVKINNLKYYIKV